MFQFNNKCFNLIAIDMNSIGDRISKVVNDSGLTRREFAGKLEMSEQAISNYIGNRRSPQAEVLLKMKQTFEVSIDWLLDGDGYKTIKSLKNLDEKDNPIIIEGEKGLPLIPIDAMAGFGTGSHQVMEYDSKKYIVPEFTELNAEFMIRVRGSSMYPKYNSGDLLACKKINRSFFQWNKVYVLDTDQGALIKRIKPSEKEDHLQCVSDNENYIPFDLHTNEINAIAIVLGVIRLE